MGEQLQHLARAAALPTVTLQVLAFAAGDHAGMSGAFTIFSFPEPDDPDVVYLGYGPGYAPASSPTCGAGCSAS
jgi:hypothetical protein